jgi:hypothetical protein
LWCGPVALPGMAPRAGTPAFMLHCSNAKCGEQSEEISIINFSCCVAALPHKACFVTTESGIHLFFVPAHPRGQLGWVRECASGQPLPERRQDVPDRKPSGRRATGKGLIGEVISFLMKPPWLDPCWEPSSWRDLYERRSDPGWPVDGCSGAGASAISPGNARRPSRSRRGAGSADAHP